MVVFTCEACNESLKKNKVEQHLFRCRRSRYVTCIDCQVDFDRESFKAHTSCISEMEKYSGPGYVAKPSANKGAKKQDDWFQRVQSAIDSCSQQRNSPLARVLYKVRESSNVPRKQAKFINFCRNSMKWANPAVIQQAWDLLAETAVTTSKENDKEESAVSDSKKRPAAAEVDEEPVEKKQKTNDEQNAETPADKELTAKKKKKKSKNRDKDVNHDEESVAGLENSEEVNEVAATEAEGKQCQEKRKKNKKKKKRESDSAQPPDADSEQVNCENGELSTQDQKQSVEDAENAEDAGQAVDGGEHSATSSKEKSKKKKRKSSQNGIDEADVEEVEETAKTDLLMKKKKKKKKSSKATKDEVPEDAETSVMTPCSA